MSKGSANSRERSPSPTRRLSKELRKGLQEAAEPIRVDAEQLAESRIPRIGFEWSRMRVGVTRTSVYVAPQQRGVKSKVNERLRRRNLADLLIGRAMIPALDANIADVSEAIDDVLATVGRAWERAA